MSPSQESYLKIIGEISKEDAPVRNKEIADELNVKGSSVTEMLERLASQGFVRYTAYKGVYLTEKGMEKITELKRRQTILIAFLSGHLNCTTTDTQFILEKLEHIDHALFFEKLEEYLHST